MAITSLTLKKLFALSGNACAFPQCRAPIYDTDEDVVTGEICHIKGKSPNGPRYDPHQTDEERNGHANLILMCSPHNKIVDDHATRHKYTVEVLIGYKEKHESQFKNSVVQPALLERFIARFRERLPVPRPSMLRIAASFLRRRPDRPIDEYGLQIRCSNRTDETINELQLEVEVPSGYELALFEIPQHVAGRSAVQTLTRALLHIKSLPAQRHVGFRLILFVPIDRYARTSNDIVRLRVSSRGSKLETKEFTVDHLTAGLRSP